MKKVIWMSFLVLALSLPSIGMAASVGNIAYDQGRVWLAKMFGVKLTASLTGI